MLFFANPCGPDVVAAIQAGRLGYIDTPAQGNKRPDGVTWVADNGCFSDRWDEGKWWRFLVENAHRADSCAFAVAPDVVADADATLARSLPWMPRIKALGYPVAFVAQDGLTIESTPWDDLDVLFIGGSTAWKLGPQARELAGEAKRRGKGVHCGRVNSGRRLRYAAAPHPFGLGADSVDGTFLTFAPEANLPRLNRWFRDLEQDARPNLFEVTP